MKIMLLETKLKNDMFIAEREELEKQGMNDGNGDG
jgi:hypothetical protein